jgi:hypothetical protein
MATVHPEGPLPSGWSERFSGVYQVHFYFNAEANVSSWDRPFLDSSGAVAFDDTETDHPAAAAPVPGCDEGGFGRGEPRAAAASPLLPSAAQFTSVADPLDPRAHFSAKPPAQPSAQPSALLVPVRSSGGARTRLRHQAQCLLCSLKGGRTHCLRCGVRDVARLQLEGAEGPVPLRGAWRARPVHGPTA